MKTIQTYKKAILQKYEAGNSEYLKQLSPAKIRQDCLLAFQNGLTNNDLIQFMRFFDFDEQATTLDNIKKIEGVDIDKFKPFKNFLNKKTEGTLERNVELIAILIDFKPRPFNNYRKQNGVESDLHSQKKNILSKDLFDHIKKKEQKKNKSTSTEQLNKITFFFNKYLLIHGSAFVIISLVFGSLKCLFFNETANYKQTTLCLVWTGEIYREMPCSNFIFLKESKVSSLDKAKKSPSFPLSKGTNEPNLWCCKMGKNKVTFFYETK